MDKIDIVFTRAKDIEAQNKTYKYLAFNDVFFCFHYRATLYESSGGQLEKWAQKSADKYLFAHDNRVHIPIPNDHEEALWNACEDTKFCGSGFEFVADMLVKANLMDDKWRKSIRTPDDLFLYCRTTWPVTQRVDELLREQGFRGLELEGD